MPGSFRTPRRRLQRSAATRRARPVLVPLLLSLLVLVIPMGGLLVPGLMPGAAAEDAAASKSPPGSESISFAAAGDHGRNATTVASLDALRKRAPVFYVALGDLSYGGTEKAWCDLVTSHVGKDFPFQLVSGNHDQGAIDRFAACLPDHMGSTGTYAKEYFFDYPKASPLARVILISPDLTFGSGGSFSYTRGSAHLRWVSDTIDQARTAGIRWVVVGMHKVCLTVGDKSCEIGPDLMNLLVDKRVDLVLQGHDHNYQRSKQLKAGGCGLRPGAVSATCIADDGADGIYRKGGGPVVVISGTFGQSPYPVDAKDSEEGYFCKLMGKNTTPTFGFVSYRVTRASITAEFVGQGSKPFTDSFRINSGWTTPGPSPTPSSGGSAPSVLPSADTRTPEPHSKGVDWDPWVGWRQGNGWNWSAVERDLDDLAGAGVTWVRTEVEQSIDSKDPQPLDRLLGLLKARGIHMLAKVQQADPRTDLCGASDGKPADPKECDATRRAFRTWLGGVVARHKADVRYWEIGNEPNLQQFWDLPETSPGSAGYQQGVANYTLHLQDAYEAIKAADPSAVVLIAGLSEWRAERYVEELTRQGKAWRFFDAFAFHPYASSPEAVVGRLNAIRATLAPDPHLADKPVWITEVGFHAEQKASRTRARPRTSRSRPTT